MKRRAFLIGSPLEEKDEHYLTGVTPDIQNMKNFLTSLSGGAWHESEISILENPSMEDLQSGLNGSYDYVVLQYSGHGFEYRDEGIYFDINAYEQVSLNAIHKWITAPKRFYFFDSCRQIQQQLIESMYKSMSTDSYNFAANDIIKQYRKKYEDIISSCEIGTSVIHSCSLHESANEDPRGQGGAFSYSFFKTAKSKKCLDGEYFSIKKVFREAVNYFNENYVVFNQQHPIIWPERRKRYFPFVI
jgi:hypothetical protein